jgi:hypothetical protein
MALIFLLSFLILEFNFSRDGLSKKIHFVRAGLILLHVAQLSEDF